MHSLAPSKKGRFAIKHEIGYWSGMSLKAEQIVGFQNDSNQSGPSVSTAATTSKCLVCEHPDGGSAHFGSTSCLACAAFFRRTVSLNIQFVCKKEKDCVIYHELRMICRSCRFDKCILAGMKRECVQKRRSNKKIPKKHMHALIQNGTVAMPNVSTSSSSTSSITASIIENAIKPLLKQEIEDSKYDEIMMDSPFSCGTEKKSPTGLMSEEASPSAMSDRFETGSQIPSTSSGIAESPIMMSIPRRPVSPRSMEFRIINMNGPDLLRYYVDQLNHCMDRRRMIFTETPMLAVMENRGDVPFPSENPPPHSLKRQYESQRFDNLLAFDFCKSCPGFDLMDRMERAIFYRACTFSYGLLDIAWITVQALPVEPEKPVIMYTDGSICTVKDMSYGWDDEDDICAIEKKKLFFVFVQRLNDAICGPLRRMKMTHVEYAALKALCIWKLGYCEYTQKMKTVGKEHEEAVLIGLQNYYEDYCKNSDEMSERLGNLILLMGTIFEMNQLIMETYKSAELFALFKIDTLSKELLSL